MYVSYVPGVPHEWFGPRYILHYTSNDLCNWEFQSQLPLSSDKVIDACVIQLQNSTWRMWYKDEVNGSHTFAADSEDLYTWSVRGEVISDCAHEGPNVFYWHGYYWMITDHWHGLGVYRSENAQDWTRGDDILQKGGKRPDDGTRGDHADILISGDNAYIFYFTHPGRIATDQAEPVNEVYPYEWKRTSLQVAELAYADGRLTCERDAPFRFRLSEPAVTE
jgi:hypothetical protein